MDVLPQSRTYYVCPKWKRFWYDKPIPRNTFCHAHTLSSKHQSGSSVFSILVFRHLCYFTLYGQQIVRLWIKDLFMRVETGCSWLIICCLYCFGEIIMLVNLTAVTKTLKDQYLLVRNWRNRLTIMIEIVVPNTNKSQKQIIINGNVGNDCEVRRCVVVPLRGATILSEIVTVFTIVWLTTSTKVGMRITTFW